MLLVNDLYNSGLTIEDVDERVMRLFALQLTRELWATTTAIERGDWIDAVTHSRTNAGLLRQMIDASKDKEMVEVLTSVIADA